MGSSISAHDDVVFVTGREFAPKLRALQFPTFVVGIGIDEAHEHVLATASARSGRTPPPFDAFVGPQFIDIFPRSLQEPSFANDPARIAMRPIPWSEPGFGVPTIARDRRRPLVYLTLGTVVGTDEVLEPAVGGLASLTPM